MAKKNFIHNQIQRGLSIAERLSLRSKKAPSGCVEWTAGTVKGYGRIRIGNRLYLAHRLSYEEAFGKIPDGMFVLHKCDNPPCINPDHLFVGDYQDNMDDMYKKGRGPSNKGTKNPNSKLTEDEVREIKYGKDPAPLLSKKFNVTRSNIYDIRKGKLWKKI